MGRQHTVQDQPDLTIPEDFIVRAKLNEIAYKTIPYTDKKTGEAKSFEKAEWWFEVTSDNQYRGRKIKGETDATLSNHPANKFRLWSSALLGKELNVGDGIDDEDLVGLQADITVRHEADRKDPEKKWERIADVIPTDAGFDLMDEPPF